MKPAYHAVVSAGVSLGFQAVEHSWPATAACFLSGVLIDLDHHLDYYIVKKQFPLRYKDLFDFCWDEKVTKVYLFLHSYEFMALFWLLIFYLKANIIWTGIALGMTVHMCFDQFTNPIKAPFYFLIYRVQNNFERAKTLSAAFYEKCKDPSF